MPKYVVYTREVHRGKWTVEAKNAIEAVNKVYNTSGHAEQHDTTLVYFTRPDGGGWEAHEIR